MICFIDIVSLNGYGINFLVGDYELAKRIAGFFFRSAEFSRSNQERRESRKCIIAVSSFAPFSSVTTRNKLPRNRLTLPTILRRDGIAFYVLNDERWSPGRVPIYRSFIGRRFIKRSDQSRAKQFSSQNLRQNV